MRLHLDLEHDLVRLGFFCEGDEVILEGCEQFLENKLVLVVDDLADGFSSEAGLAPLDDFDKPFHLLIVLLPDFFVAFNLEFQTFGVIYPVNAFAPGEGVAEPLEDLLELPLGGSNVLVLRINDQVVVLGEERNEGSALLLGAPGQLLQEAEELALVDGVALGEAAHVDDPVQRDTVALQLLQDLLSNRCPIVQLIESRNVQNAKADFLPCDFEGGAVVEVDLGGDFLEAVGHLDGGVAGEELGGSALAGA